MGGVWVERRAADETVAAGSGLPASNGSGSPFRACFDHPGADHPDREIGTLWSSQCLGAARSSSGADEEAAAWQPQPAKACTAIPVGLIQARRGAWRALGVAGGVSLLLWWRAARPLAHRAGPNWPFGATIWPIREKVGQSLASLGRLGLSWTNASKTWPKLVWTRFGQHHPTLRPNRLAWVESGACFARVSTHAAQTNKYGRIWTDVRHSGQPFDKRWSRVRQLLGNFGGRRNRQGQLFGTCAEQVYLSGSCVLSAITGLSEDAAIMVARVFVQKWCRCHNLDCRRATYTSPALRPS